MAYCVGNCLSWDSVSGNLTINEDPLGGLECLPGGQRIRIAGGRTGVAVNAQNNGLFMTAAGELATLNTPQFRTYRTNTAGVDIQSTAANGTYNYARTPDIIMTNPSTSYYMFVISTLSFHSNYQVRGSVSGVSASGYRWVNGVASEVGGPARTNSNFISNHTDYRDVVQYNAYDTVAPGGSITLAASQIWTVSDSTVAPFFYGAYTKAEYYGLIMPRI